MQMWPFVDEPAIIVMRVSMIVAGMLVFGVIAAAYLLGW